MAYVVPRAGGRFELRESAWTAAGPRSRTLAAFKKLDREVMSKVLARQHGALSREDLIEAARRAGAPVSRPPADEAAVQLIEAFERGDELSPTIARLLQDRLGSAETSDEALVTDSERAAAAWLGRSLSERGNALRDLLLLADRLPGPERSEALEFPSIRTAAHE